MKKYLVVALGLILAVSVSAFTLHKTSVPKTTALNWYRVTYDASHPSGAILNSSDFYVQDIKDNVDSPCDAGAVKDCLRGFVNPLTSFPNANPGMDQIQKP